MSNGTFTFVPSQQKTKRSFITMLKRIKHGNILLFTKNVKKRFIIVQSCLEHISKLILIGKPLANYLNNCMYYMAARLLLFAFL